MSMRMTAVSLNPVLGSNERALEWVRRLSPNAQYTAAADGKVKVITYRVAIRYIILNFCGFHIACIISLHYNKINYKTVTFTIQNYKLWQIPSISQKPGLK